MCLAVDDHRIMHGFLPGRSPVTNAQEHVGYKFTLTLDIEDFFDACNALLWDEDAHPEYTEIRNNAAVQDSILWELVEHRQGTTNNSQLSICPQGLPTSPFIANLVAAHKLDVRINHWMRNCTAGLRRLWNLTDDQCRWRYTRYADDLTISYNHHFHRSVQTDVGYAVGQDCGFKLAEHKTKLYSAACGYRIITGIAVGDDHIRMTRKSRRKLRAARHQHRTHSIRGHEEWSELKQPTLERAVRRTRIAVDALLTEMVSKGISDHESVTQFNLARLGADYLERVQPVNPSGGLVRREPERFAGQAVSAMLPRPSESNGSAMNRRTRENSLGEMQEADHLDMSRDSRLDYAFP